MVVLVNFEEHIHIIVLKSTLEQDTLKDGITRFVKVYNLFEK